MNHGHIVTVASSLGLFSTAGVEVSAHARAHSAITQQLIIILLIMDFTQAQQVHLQSDFFFIYNTRGFIHGYFYISPLQLSHFLCALTIYICTCSISNCFSVSLVFFPSVFLLHPSSFPPSSCLSFSAPLSLPLSPCLSTSILFFSFHLSIFLSLCQSPFFQYFCLPLSSSFPPISLIFSLSFCVCVPLCVSASQLLFASGVIGPHCIERTHTHSKLFVYTMKASYSILYIHDLSFHSFML